MRSFRPLRLLSRCHPTNGRALESFRIYPCGDACGKSLRMVFSSTTAAFLVLLNYGFFLLDYGGLVLLQRPHAGNANKHRYPTILKRTRASSSAMPWVGSRKHYLSLFLSYSERSASFSKSCSIAVSV